MYIDKKTIREYLGYFLVGSYYVLTMWMIVSNGDAVNFLYYLFLPIIAFPSQIIGLLFADFWSGVLNGLWLFGGIYLIVKE